MQMIKKSLLAVAVACCLILTMSTGRLVTSQAHAGPVGAKLRDAANFSAAVILHGNIPANEVDNLNMLVGGVNWVYTGTISNTAAAGATNDTVAFNNAQVQHMGNANKLNYGFNAQAGVTLDSMGNLLNAGVHFIKPSTDIVAHGNDRDVLSADMTVLVNNGNKTFANYDIAVVTSHVMAPPKGKGVGNIQGETATSSPNIHGSAAWILDDSTNDFQLALGVSGLLSDEVTEASICLGSSISVPCSPGSVIMDLPTSMFQDIAGLGMGLTTDFVFPSADLDALLAGNTFIEISSSQGSFSGQLQNLVPEPGTLLLLATSLIGFLWYATVVSRSAAIL